MLFVIVCHFGSRAWDQNLKFVSCLRRGRGFQELPAWTFHKQNFCLGLQVWSPHKMLDSFQQEKWAGSGRLGYMMMLYVLLICVGDVVPALTCKIASKGSQPRPLYQSVSARNSSASAG